MTLYPFTFHPIFKERIWGGRKLEQLYHKSLPPHRPIGESWEISDRPGDVSVITNGAFAGKDLHWLVQQHGEELMGGVPLLAGRFPLLCKILDAHDKLSLQVHPPASVAAKLGGDPKTEMWLIADAAPGAELYAGLKRGVTREEFEEKIRRGTVAECFHRLPMGPGDALFLPSGRVHAIGAGLVIFEIQQNSDTTYRVFDWNRVGLDGKPRDLHLQESLQSIDFNDFEPVPMRAADAAAAAGKRLVATDPLFSVEAYSLKAGATVALPPARMQILGVLSGEVQAGQTPLLVELGPGQFCLIPASLELPTLQAKGGAASFLRIEAGRGSSTTI
jgi:mannose-6-phosphate isomerase